MTRFMVVKRAGRHAIVRVLPSGDAAGYDAVADREKQQVHFRIHHDTPHATAIDKAFQDSRKYRSLDEAVAAADGVGREVAVALGSRRVVCPYCERSVSVNKDRRVRLHGNPAGGECLGSKRPADTMEFSAAERRGDL